MVLLLSIGVLIYSSKNGSDALISNQKKYLKHTYWTGVIILLIGLFSILFMTPIFILYAIFIGVRVLFGLIYLFLERKLIW